MNHKKAVEIIEVLINENRPIENEAWEAWGVILNKSEALKKKVTKIYDYAYGLIEDEYHGTLSLDDEIKELDEYIKETE